MKSLYRPCDFQEDGFFRCNNNQNMKVVKLSALLTGRLYSSGKYSVYSLLSESTAVP